MNVRKLRSAATAILLAAGATVFQGCPLSGLFDNCFGENTVSGSEYNDLNFFEQLLYEENSCGRYEQRFGSDD